MSKGKRGVALPERGALGDQWTLFLSRPPPHCRNLLGPTVAGGASAGLDDRLESAAGDDVAAGSKRRRKQQQRKQKHPGHAAQRLVASQAVSAVVFGDAGGQASASGVPPGEAAGAHADVEPAPDAEDDALGDDPEGAAAAAPVGSALGMDDEEEEGGGSCVGAGGAGSSAAAAGAAGAGKPAPAAAPVPAAVTVEDLCYSLQVRRSHVGGFS